LYPPPNIGNTPETSTSWNKDNAHVYPTRLHIIAKLTLAVDGTGVFDSTRITTNNVTDWNFILSI